MANDLNNRPLVPSILDRLLDDDPGVSREPAVGRHQRLRELKQTVRRDLEDLLNTRRRNLTWSASLEELSGSLIDYGLPDFTGASLASTQDRDEFCRLVETVIRHYEPRLLNPRVQALGDAEPVDRTFRFRIDALLRVEPAPEPVVFDSVLRPATGTFEVRGVGG